MESTETVKRRIDYSKFISEMSRSRMPSGFSDMESCLEEAAPSLVYLATGQPNPYLFPFKEANFTIEDGSTLRVTPEIMRTVLQYGSTQGYAPLLAQLREMVQKVHNPPRWDESNVIVTVGVQDGLAKAFEMMLDPEDFVVIEEPCYSDALCILSAMKPTYLKVESDEGGMRPESLRKILQDAVKRKPDRPPKVLFVVPNVNNPSGITLEAERRKQIYAIASEYNLIICEDDPYYYLQYDQEKIAPSFLSLDTEGRVLRFDSFSKIVSSGLRVGYVTGPKYLLQKMLCHMDASSQCPGITQVMISELLKQWGEEGFQNHIDKLRHFYRSQRDAMVLAANTYLKGLCKWREPSGGLFIWFKVPGLRDTHPMLKKRAVKKDVLLLPGKDFMLDPKIPCQYMRAAYTIATPQMMMEAMKNLADLIREEIILQGSQD